jgi:hypothetical protein
MDAVDDRRNGTAPTRPPRPHASALGPPRKNCTVVADRRSNAVVPFRSKRGSDAYLTMISCLRKLEWGLETGDCHYANRRFHHT